MRNQCIDKNDDHTVNIVGSPLNGLAKRAPSSEIVVNLLRETS
jgi:hypothetical protein